MRSKRSLLKKSLLYLILDKKTSPGRPLKSIVSGLENTGIDIIQLRDKSAKKEIIIKESLILHKLLLNSSILFIVNDYPDVAKIVDADGLHIGQADMPIRIARQILGSDKIIGVSCHNLDQALAAQDNGADYIAIGPLFPTATKPGYKAIGLELIKELNKKLRIPFFVIGDVNLSNLSQIIASGAKRVAVCRAILKQPDMASSARKFSQALCQRHN